MENKDIYDWMKQYNFSDILKWIQCTSIHPNNQVFQIRFEMLICALMTINIQDFNGLRLSRNDFVKFIEKYFNETDRGFHIFEDFKSFNQLQLIPYYRNGVKKYFFYGALERPYEILSKFDTLYSNIKIDDKKIGDLLEVSLDFQTNLLNKMIKIQESNHTQEGLYIPSYEFVEDLWTSFYVKNDEVQTFEKYSTFNYKQMNSDSVTLPQIIDRIYVRDELNNRIFIIPQIHLEALYNIALNIISSDKRLQGDLSQQLYRAFEELFNKNILVTEKVDYVVNDADEKILTKNTFFYRLHDDVVIIFYLYNENDPYIIDCSPNIIERVNDIKKYKYIRFVFHSGLKSEEVKLDNVELVPVFIYDFYSIGGRLNVKGASKDYAAYQLNDIEALFEVFSNMEEIYKFIREEMKLNRKFEFVAVDQIDKLGYYIQNGKTFFEAGKMCDRIAIEPHMWSDYFMKYLYNKYSDDIYEFLEKVKPGYFNYVNKSDYSIYSCINKYNLVEWNVLKKENNHVVVRFPISAFTIRNELSIRLGEKVLKPLFLEYVDKLYTRLAEVLKVSNFSFGEVYYIELVPVEIVEDRFNILKEYVPLVSSTNSIVIRTLLNSKDNSIHTFVIYDASNMQNLFDNKMNTGEKHCVKELIYSLLLYNYPDYDSKHLMKFSDEVTELYCPNRKRRYGITSYKVENPRSIRYASYQRVNSTDKSVVYKEVAEHFSNTALTPGIYKGDDASKICIMTLEYLTNKIKSGLRKFNISALNYAYKELEFVEEERERILVQSKYDMGTEVDFNIIDKTRVELDQISEHSMAIKYLIHSMLKYGCEGNADMTYEKWAPLLANAMEIEVTSVINDMSRWNLQNYEVEITEIFEIKDNFSELIFSSNKYSNRLIEYRLNDLKGNSTGKELELIEVAFKEELGFSIYEMIRVLTFLGQVDQVQNLWYPINYVSLFNEKNYICSSLNLDVEYVEKIINYLSLDFNTFNEINVISNINLIRWKSRINLCPIIKFADNIIYGNRMCLKAANLWMGYFSRGDIPYSLDLPKEILKASKKIHRELDLSLEKFVEEEAIKIVGKDSVEARIDNFRRLSDKFIAKPDCGEIDLLVVNKKTKKLFVIDAKNINKRFRPYDINQEITHFFNEKDGYLIKLSKKEKFIRGNLEVILKYFNVDNKEKWCIKKAFFVDNIFPSAFIKEDVDFITIDQLEDYLLN